MYYSKQGAKPDQYLNVLEAELEDAGREVAEVTNPLGEPDDSLVAPGRERPGGGYSLTTSPR